MKKNMLAIVALVSLFVFGMVSTAWAYSGTVKASMLSAPGNKLYGLTEGTADVASKITCYVAVMKDGVLYQYSEGTKYSVYYHGVATPQFTPPWPSDGMDSYWTDGLVRIVFPDGEVQEGEDSSDIIRIIGA